VAASGGTAGAVGGGGSGRHVRAAGARPRLVVVASSPAGRERTDEPLARATPGAGPTDEDELESSLAVVGVDRSARAAASDDEALPAEHGLTVGSSAVVIAASGSSLAAVLDEAGAALAECTAGVDVGAPAAIWERFDVGGDDPANLGRDFIDELVDRADRHRHEIVSVLVDRVDGPGGAAAWHVVGRIGLRPFGPRPDATRHVVGHPRPGRVHVDGAARHWALRATLPLRD
jgi:hypothetical protein